MTKYVVLLVAIFLSSAAYACTAFFQYEEKSGMNKICYYDHLGDKVAINVKAHQLCPLTIKVRH